MFSHFEWKVQRGWKIITHRRCYQTWTYIHRCNYFFLFFFPPEVNLLNSLQIASFKRDFIDVNNSLCLPHELCNVFISFRLSAAHSLHNNLLLQYLKKKTISLKKYRSGNLKLMQLNFTARANMKKHKYKEFWSIQNEIRPLFSYSFDYFNFNKLSLALFGVYSFHSVLHDDSSCQRHSQIYQNNFNHRTMNFVISETGKSYQKPKDHSTIIALTIGK